MKLSSRIIVCLCCFVLLLTLSSSAFGKEYRWEVTATNNSGAARTDLHVLFSGTGGTIANQAVISNDGPGAVTGIAVVGGNEIQIDWGAPGLGVGNTVKFTFTTTNAPVTVASATWTPGDVPAGEGDVIIVEKVPSLTEWGLLVLVALLVASGVYVAIRRRQAVRA